MMRDLNALFMFGTLTSIGTAILTAASVWRLLMKPLNDAIQSIKDDVKALAHRIESNDTKTQSDIKDLWKHLAERAENRE